MSKLKTRVGTWVLVFLKELGQGDSCAVALPGFTAGTCPARPQQRQRHARGEAGWNHERALQHM